MGAALRRARGAPPRQYRATASTRLVLSRRAVLAADLRNNAAHGRRRLRRGRTALSPLLGHLRDAAGYAEARNRQISAVRLPEDRRWKDRVCFHSRQLGPGQQPRRRTLRRESRNRTAAQPGIVRRLHLSQHLRELAAARGELDLCDARRRWAEVVRPEAAAERARRRHRAADDVRGTTDLHAHLESAPDVPLS